MICRMNEPIDLLNNALARFDPYWNLTYYEPLRNRFTWPSAIMNRIMFVNLESDLIPEVKVFSSAFLWKRRVIHVKISKIIFFFSVSQLRYLHYDSI